MTRGRGARLSTRGQSPHRPGHRTGIRAWLLTLLAAVGLLVLGTGTASAAPLPEAGTRVRVSTPETITPVGVSEHIAAGQGRGPPVLQGQIVVATGVAAETADGAAAAGRAGTAAKSCLNSFTADTPVTLADGTKKPIKDVKVGDKVDTLAEHGNGARWMIIDE